MKLRIVIFPIINVVGIGYFSVIASRPIPLNSYIDLGYDRLGIKFWGYIGISGGAITGKSLALA